MGMCGSLGTFGDERLEKRGSRFWSRWCRGRAFAFDASGEVSGAGSSAFPDFWRIHG